MVDVGIIVLGSYIWSPYEDLILLTAQYCNEFHCFYITSTSLAKIRPEPTNKFANGYSVHTFIYINVWHLITLSRHIRVYKIVTKKQTQLIAECIRYKLKFLSNIS